jgi:hypothetical protein
VLSLTTNIDRLPLQIRKLGISAAALTLGNMKDEKPEGVTDAQDAVRGAILDEGAALVKLLLQDGGAVQLKFDLDRKKHELSLSFSLEGKNGSTLAKNLAALGEAKGMAAALAGGDSAVRGFLHASLPASVRKVLGPAVDEAIKNGLEKMEKEAKERAEPLAEAFKATLKEGTLDAGLSLRGPGKGGKYTLAGSLQVTSGDAIEKAFRKAVDKLSDEEKKAVKIDAAKAEGVNIHSVQPDNLPPIATDLFGEGPVYFALRKDVLVYAFGEKAIDVLKTALAGKPKAGGLMQVEASVKRIAELLANLNPTVGEVAKKAFADKDGDKVRLSITAGNRLEVKLSANTAALAFISLLQKARMEAEQGE